MRQVEQETAARAAECKTTIAKQKHAKTCKTQEANYLLKTKRAHLEHDDGYHFNQTMATNPTVSNEL